MKGIFKRNIYLLLGLTALCSGIIGCDDRIDDPVPPVSGQELVTVPLSFGFAEESIGELYRNGSPPRLAATARRPGTPHRLSAKSQKATAPPPRPAPPARRNAPPQRPAAPPRV